MLRVPPRSATFVLAVGLATGALGACSGSASNAPLAASPPAADSAPKPVGAAPSPPVITVPPDADASSGPRELTSKALPLPGAIGPAFLDYIVYEAATSRVWVPVGSTGTVDVLGVATETFTRIDGFKTREREVNTKKRTYGPSAAAVGDGFVYIGNRATSEICPVDVKTLKTAKCLKLDVATDGVAYAELAKEVWVTNPQARALTVLDASNPGRLTLRTTVKTDGAPEGYAVDDAHELFFTNLEDKGSTVAIDIRTRKVKATWSTGCGSDGPRGIAFDRTHDFVLVACTDHVQVLDATHDGALLGRLDTGPGLDNIDFVDGRVSAAAGKAARLTIARVDAGGQFAIVASGTTSEGARNAVFDASGNVYVADSLQARLLVFDAPSAK
jgi:DNA-binding beta-propeller fold protein YncE